jgi:hypothetical protein
MDPSATRSSPSVGGDRGTNPTDPPFSFLGGASWVRRTVATFGRSVGRSCGTADVVARASGVRHGETPNF